MGVIMMMMMMVVVVVILMVVDAAVVGTHTTCEERTRAGIGATAQSATQAS